jgi:hypothetical protein
MADPAFEALWKAVLDRWTEDRTHGAFIEYCDASDQLAEAAARYRGMKGDRDRSASADKRLVAISIIAIAKLEATRSPALQRGRSVGYLLLAATLAAGAIGLLAYLWATR